MNDLNDKKVQKLLKILEKEIREACKNKLFDKPHELVISIDLTTLKRV